MSNGSYLIAFVAIISLNIAFLVLLSALRKISYLRARRRELLRKNEVFAKKTDLSQYRLVYNRLRSETNRRHSLAVQKQNDYQENLTSIGVFLFTSLAALFALSFFNSVSFLYEILLWVEVFALGAAFIRYRQSNVLRQLWLDARSESEISRTLRSLFPLTRPACNMAPADAVEVFRKKLLAHLELFGRGAGSYECSANALVQDSLLHFDPSVTKEDAKSYVRTRIMQQRIWYEESESRLEKEMEGTSLVTMAIYCITITLAVGKLTVFYLGDFPYQKELKYALSASLFLGAILSGFITYYNFSRLNASLRQIYIRQADTIKKLLNSVEQSNWWIAEEESHNPLSADDSDQLKQIVRDFERSKIDEHVRWLTSRRLIEVELG